MTDDLHRKMADHHKRLSAIIGHQRKELRTQFIQHLGERRAWESILRDRQKKADQAADRITALQAQNRKLVEALRPFAARVKELSRSHLNINDGDEVLVSGKYLLAAYDAIAEAEKGEG